MPHDERLLIENFGPIHTADLAIRDLTVLVGPQASGKSLAAQLLYFMRGMEELLPGPPLQEPDNSFDMPGTTRIPELEALELWLGGYLTRFANKQERQCVLRWWPKGAPGDSSNRLSLAHQLDHAARRLLYSATYQPNSPSSPERQIYIPAGRTLFSFVSPGTALQLISQRKINWPGFITLFYQKLDSIIRSLGTENSQRKGMPATSRTKDDYIDIKFAEALRCEIAYLQGKVNLLVKAGEGTLLQFIDPLRAASGQMEAWPFVAVVQDVLNNPSVTRRIFFEEPEAHLHPTAQRGLLDVVAALTNRKQRFVLTTHSPYVIYAINNYLLARQVLDKGRKLPSPELEQTALRPDQVAAYRFTTDGQVESLFDEETGLLKTGELDDPAAALSATFSDLQDALFEDDK
jgi:hypothetical protein